MTLQVKRECLALVVSVLSCRTINNMDGLVEELDNSVVLTLFLVSGANVDDPIPEQNPRFMGRATKARCPLI